MEALFEEKLIAYTLHFLKNVRTTSAISRGVQALHICKGIGTLLAVHRRHAFCENATCRLERGIQSILSTLARKPVTKCSLVLILYANEE